ncbi:phosphoribosylamine--glycine ligase [Methanomethylovorans hollandica DSM 15978]|uniref:Phosphoribosylamine--glycine ligase n=1 Tax=Methanomethylovorans hollandica (strain DSM 15978 / NBRC 107637 / DMS1) TaxID=867904 RepID=L0L166_METHD|nr:phosphoribosylamine--glycine ligase [Methanomethylovorans hollandica]AGB50143.1 phosphoribosylamine--glycine ligase [Methanomethylovorans hollandica DSM 15978]
MNVLVVGGGGREHAIAASIAQSRKDPVIFGVMAKKNPGIARLCQDFLLEKETDVKKIVAYATANNVDLAFIGPEAPLAAGLADALEDVGIGVVGPRKAVAQIEFDKAWARNFMRKHGIEGCPIFEVFTEKEPMFDFIAKLGNVAIKPAGLTGGKGVKVMGDQLPTVKDAQEYAAQLLESGSVVVEENLVGEEFTLQAFVDGEHLAFSPAVQDHKRAFENDLGPNTGGMGAYTDASEVLPFLIADDVEQAKRIMLQTVKELYTETGVKYKGVLYGQFMITKNGPRVIEFNARFGDPEAMNVLPLLETDIVDVMSAVVGGTLDRLEVKFSKKATVCKYAVPAGYPDNPSKDKEVSVGDVGDALVFYASVYEENNNIYTTGSRAIAVVGIADSIAKAEKKAQEALDNIIGDLHSRRDIGTSALIQKRIDHMKKIRGKI